MRKLTLSFPLIAVILALAVAPASSQRREKRRFNTTLLGINEVGGGIGAVSTAAKGTFRATLSEDGTTFSYRLRFSGLESDVLMAHIHVGQTFTTGGISVWLCQTAANPAPAAVLDITPQCFEDMGDPRNGTIVGTFTAENVIGPTNSLVGAGEFAELVKLMREGVTYANVHTTGVPSGEIRGQVQ